MVKGLCDDKNLKNLTRKGHSENIFEISPASDIVKKKKKTL